MPKRFHLVALLVVATLQVSAIQPLFANSNSAGGFSLATAFDYQGSLQRSGSPANGRFDLRFELFDGARGSHRLGSTEQRSVVVENGRFVTQLDFDLDVFSLETPFVQVYVRSTGVAEEPYVQLEPRQRLAGAGGGCTVDEDLQINGTLLVDAAAGEPGLVLPCSDSGGPFCDSAVLSLNSFFSSTEISSTHLQRYGFGLPGGDFLINPIGGDVGIGVLQTEAPLSLPSGPDVSLSAGGVLILGAVNGPNLSFDNNEIQARNNGAPSTLFLNNDGSRVRIGGRVDIGIERVVVGSPSTTTQFLDAVCPAGKTIISGGCSAGVSNLIQSTVDLQNNLQACAFEEGSILHQAIALCGRLQ